MQQHFEFQSSRYLVILLTGTHGSAAAILLFLELPWGWRYVLLAAVLLSSLYYLLRDAWLCLPSSCTGLLLGETGAVLIRRDGRHLPCQILPTSVVTPWLTVLNALPESARFKRDVILLPDSLSAESFRRLRVWLKWR